jgi:hypothetical protein
MSGTRWIIFGAGAAGRCALHHLRGERDIIGFADNDPAKHGQRIDGLPIHAPAELAGIPHDGLLIASEFFEAIQRTLVEQHGYPAVRIEIAPAWMIKPMSFGGDTPTRALARQLLIAVSGLLTAAGIRHHLEAGTLLGLVREGDLIAWDNDLDLAIAADDVPAAARALGAGLRSLPEDAQRGWTLSEQRAATPFGPIPVGAVRSLKLGPSADTAGCPALDVFPKYAQDGTSWWMLASRGMTAPATHLAQLGTVAFHGAVLPIPSRAEDYLTAMYGDWRTPKRDWHFGMYHNTTTF